MVDESRKEPVAAPAAEEPAATEVVEEAPEEAGLTWRPDRDCCPVELVSEHLSRVVHVCW
jgi:hypothetical protein